MATDTIKTCPLSSPLRLPPPVQLQLISHPPTPLQLPRTAPLHRVPPANSSLSPPGPEYGTTEAAWKAVLNESDQVCDLHLRVKDNLLNQVHSNLKNWQKENYHKVTWCSSQVTNAPRVFSRRTHTVNITFV